MEPPKVSADHLNYLYAQLNRSLSFPNGDYAEDISKEVVRAIDSGANIPELREVFQRYIDNQKEVRKYISTEIDKQERIEEQRRKNRKGLSRILNFFD